MAVLAGTLTSVGNPLRWSLLFARQPEPDLEFTEEELDQTTATRPVSPMKHGKKSGGGRPMLWILLLMLIGGIGYLAMEPEQLTEWLAPFMGERAPEPPPIAMRPKPPTTPPAAPATQPAPEEAAPIAAAPSAAVPTPTAPTAPAPPPSAAAPITAPIAPTPNAVMSPLFAEGQKVTVIGNPTLPAETIPLSLDPAGTKPGPVVRPGVTLSILDGDLQPGGWVYSVRTDDGMKGWISEKRLRLKF
ncbi:MAG TPA: SH3 domain-containing protein [Nitrospira sp.]|nr:SH3 domain-containing protein [Nitrospira sp.]